MRFRLRGLLNNRLAPGIRAPLRCWHCGELIGREDFARLTVMDDGRRAPAVAHQRCVDERVNQVAERPRDA